MRILIVIILASFLVTAQPTQAATVPGSLVKTACPNGATVSDPCKAVYFYGSDGKRHAFPNEKTYFTWYADFAGVQTVTATFMASLPLGPNVTYRPGVKMIKFTTDKVYSVALGGVIRWVSTETVARNLYGTNWNTKIDDASDAFFTDYRAGADIATSADYLVADELSAAPTIDANLESTHRRMNVATTRGTFDTDVITLHRDRFAMITDTAETDECANNCPTKSLADFATESGATIGIHGTYFCPPDYADCVGKVNTFLSPVYDTAPGAMRNEWSLQVHEGPMLISTTNGKYSFFHRTKDFGTTVASYEAAHGVKLEGALANYPSLVEHGTVIVESETRLDDGQRTVKGVRGGIGMNDRFIYMVIARNATVVDLATIMKTLGATDALNLDGGGSAALLYDSTYKVGPGRTLPNAILFKKRQ